MSKDDAFTVVGPPDELGVEERACLLRAGRKQLEALQSELLRMEQLPTAYAAGPVAAVQAEINCLSRGISWLWRQAIR